MHHTTEILLALFVVFVAAQVGAEIAQRLKLPAVVGEIAAGCVVGPSGLGWVKVSEPLEKREALIVGVGMVPRGEVGIIVASLGQQAGVFSGTTYAVIIAMSLLTSVVAPPALKRLLAGALPEAHSRREAGENGEAPEGEPPPSDTSRLISIEETGHE